MKLAVVALTVLGMLAAGSAALVLKTIRPVHENSTVRVLMVQSDLPAMTRLAAEDVKLETVARAALPKGCFLDPSQVIGRILSTPLMKGQLLTESALVTRGSLTERMMTLPPGTTIATVTVPSRSINAALLQPGCYVHVSAALRASSASDAGVISGTLFREMQVWSTGDEPGGLDVSEQEQTKSKSSGAGITGTVKVNLLATHEQARILQMVGERGTITLTIRNPREVAQSDPQTELVADEGLRRALGLVPEEPAAVELVVVQDEPVEINEPEPIPAPQVVKVILGSNVRDEIFPSKDEGDGRNQ